MKAEYEEKLPQWYKDNKQYDLILTDDIDSLLACAILKKVKDWDIEYVMLFKADKCREFDYLGKTSNATNETVGVDLALHKGKCFDNHMSRCIETDPINEECINPNMFRNISRRNYTDKYNSSTVLLLWSLYNLPLPDSEEGKMILLCIDGTYQSYYHSNSKYNIMNKHYLCDVLGLEELYKCQQRHKQYEFKEIEKKYKLKEKIKASKGFLQTEIDLIGVNIEVGLTTDIWCELPKSRFALYKKFRDIQMPLKGNEIYKTKLEDIIQNPYSVALTKRDFICYSEEIAS